MHILYLDDYKIDEQSHLASLGVGCARMSLTDALAEHGLDSLNTDVAMEVRGHRLSSVQFEQLHARAREAGLSFTTSPRAYKIGGSFALQYPLLGNLSPGAMVATAEASDAELATALCEVGLRLPLFVRSEIESAAKYVGVGGCVVTVASERGVGAAVGNLRRHVAGFRSIIFKEMAEIGVDTNSGQPLEYRAVATAGRFLLFDFDACDGLPNPISLGLQSYVETALERLAGGGADGSFFLDIAMTEEKPIVVECKNLLNGTIKAVRRFGEALLRTY